MKKFIIFIMFFLLPINVFAYSKYVIPGGNTLGIEVSSDGIMIIGFYKIDGKFNKSALKSGDYIIKINNESVNNVNEMTSIIEKYINDDYVNIEYIRNGKTFTTKMPLIVSNNKIKTGLYVKDSIKGIGTLTYIDPETKIYGALGHEIIESNTSKVVEVKSGLIFNNEITGIEKSTAGNPGSKIASFNYNIKYGTVIKNTKYGIFGIYENNFPSSQLIEVSNDIKIGPATLRTVIDGENINEYNIEIIAINENSSTKNLTIKIIDESLLSKTGGVVQGMSGSPIVQNNKIVGALTHVIVDNPVTGYGIFITSMLDAGENN